MSMDNCHQHLSNSTLRTLVHVQSIQIVKRLVGLVGATIHAVWRAINHLLQPRGLAASVLLFSSTFLITSRVVCAAQAEPKRVSASSPFMKQLVFPRHTSSSVPHLPYSSSLVLTWKAMLVFPASQHVSSRHLRSD